MMMVMRRSGLILDVLLDGRVVLLRGIEIAGLQRLRKLSERLLDGICVLRGLRLRIRVVLRQRLLKRCVV